MDDFNVMYKILKYLKASMAAEEFDENQISAARLGVSELLIERLLIMMQDDGYIRGLVTYQGLTDDHRRLAKPVRPEITINGLDYLETNSMMAKAAKAMMEVL